jgi:hypothetical protein
MWRANKRSTHLPIAPAARYHQYRSLGGGGRCLQLWERGPAEELHLRHIKTSRGEFRLSYDANQTEYSPSPPHCSSLRLISIGERKSGSGRTDQPRNSRRHPVEHHEVSFGCDGKQECKQNTHLPLVSRARYNQYQLGGGVMRRWR